MIAVQSFSVDRFENKNFWFGGFFFFKSDMKKFSDCMCNLPLKNHVTGCDD